MRGTGYEYVPLSREGARLLVRDGERRAVEVVASNNAQCLKDVGCVKPNHEPEDTR